MRRHRQSVSSVVRRIVSCPADAEEVVQDVFVVVWKHAVRFRGEAKVTTWIHTIARNTPSHDYVRVMACRRWRPFFAIQVS
jgi:RNA polymerase sigma-70 factor (ECF subfamily)